MATPLLRSDWSNIGRRKRVRVRDENVYTTLHTYVHFIHTHTRVRALRFPILDSEIFTTRSTTLCFILFCWLFVFFSCARCCLFLFIRFGMYVCVCVCGCRCASFHHAFCLHQRQFLLLLTFFLFEKLLLLFI